jgi:hypothetical protein
VARKRLNSDDKYDNKEYIEKMEAQLDQMIRKQFPVEEDVVEDDRVGKQWTGWTMMGAGEKSKEGEGKGKTPW